MSKVVVSWGEEVVCLPFRMEVPSFGEGSEKLGREGEGVERSFVDGIICVVFGVLMMTLR